ncbi:hypothetical protein LCGC14_3113900 [marine sediment metagenome]|uniref:Uncharacterized protein n=1 Tax=marine sediment metagenome TaxID=412755 RepID=A0A0F8WTA0_9ZZZZ
MNETTRAQIARQIVRAIQGGSLNYIDPKTITEIESWERILNIEPAPKKTVRVLRFIEYVGTPEFIDDCIARRGLKGTRVLPGGFMREAILGDTAEVLSDDEVEELGVCRPKTT